MKIFVTGATGFIGRSLCTALHAAGHELTVLLRSPKKLSLLPSGVGVIEGDLGLFRKPDLVLPEFEVVIHLAAVIAGKNEADYFQTNFDSVVDVVECLKRQSWRPKNFVFASSLAAAGPSPKGKVWTEADPGHPIDAYGKAKLKAEEYLAQQDFPTTSFRPTIVLGPGDEASFTLYKMARTGIGFIPGGPPQQITFVFVSDLARAIQLMVPRPENAPLHRVYFVNHPRFITNQELMLVVGKALGKDLTLIRMPHFLLKSASLLMTGLSGIFGFQNQLDEKQYLQMVAPAFLCSSAKLEQELGWQAEMDFEAGLADAVKGYREMGWL
ncbi:MAG: NAD(P)-dependent oxidoreductase [Bacteroidia bacterium]|nr:NAD(P)-dependent oxidoreductase [Bacteroidia bacterium]